MGMLRAKSIVAFWLCLLMQGSLCMGSSLIKDGGEGLWSGGQRIYESTGTLLVTGRFFENYFLDQSDET